MQVAEILQVEPPKSSKDRLIKLLNNGTG